MTKKIALTKDLRDFADVFYKAGYVCYFVGGSIRDSFLGLSAHDWDAATNAEPHIVRKLFKHVIPTGIQHGTVTVRFRALSIETTTFRTDGEYCDGRRPCSVRFTDDLLSDLARRDFTINGMALDPRSGNVVDPHGGRADIQARIVRAIGNPVERFTEDGLRPLRAIRFAARLGFTIEPETLAAISQTLGSFRLVSQERIRDEFTKIILSDNAEAALYTLSDTGLLREFLPELEECRGVGQDSEYHNYDVFGHSAHTAASAPLDLVIRLAALLHDIEKPSCLQTKADGGLAFYGHEKKGAATAERILRRLKYSNAVIDSVTHLVAEHMFHYTDDWTDAAVRRFIARVGIEYIRPLLQLRLADTSGKGFGTADPRALMPLMERVDKVIAKGEALSIKKLALSGNDLAEAGWPRGPAMGKVLQELLNCVLDDPALNTKEKLLFIADKLRSKITQV